MSVWQYYGNSQDGDIQSIFRVTQKDGTYQWMVLHVNGTRFNFEDVSDDGEVFSPERGWFLVFRKEADKRAIRRAAIAVREDGALMVRSEGKMVRFRGTY